jgi:hypothetical protein
MGIHRGPNPVNDGLTFGCDTGYGIADNSTATRFYPGEATENLANTESLRTMANYGGGTTTYAEAPEKGPGWKKVTITAINGSNHRLSKFPYISHPTNTTRTYSLELDFNGTSGYYVRGDGFTGLGPNVSTSGVHSWTLITTTNSGVMALFLNNGRSAVTGLNDVIYYRYYQVEAKGHATPFTATTRSSTASLIDLKRTTNIDVSNVSFDSTGQPTFDGSDDIIDLTLPQDFQDKLTIETWYKGTDSSRNHLWNFTGSGNLNCNFNDSSYTLWLYWDGGGSNYLRFTTPQFCDSEIHHIVFVHEGSTNKVYLDGVLLTNGVAGGTQTFNSKIGSTYDVGGTRYFQGDVYVNRVYNKALTATEVKQNYNAYKNRFDI